MNHVWGRRFTQEVAGRPRSCRLTDGLGLRVELWAGAWSRPPWGSVGLAQRGPRLAFSAEGIETAEWLQNVVAWLSWSWCPRSSLRLSDGGVTERSDFLGL